MLTAQDLVLPHSVLIAGNILGIIGMMLLDSLPDTDRTFTYSPFKEAGPVFVLVLWICDCWTFVFMVPRFAREQGHRQSNGPDLAPRKATRSTTVQQWPAYSPVTFLPEILITFS
jgi:hypothetical protein